MTLEELEKNPELYYRVRKAVLEELKKHKDICELLIRESKLPKWAVTDDFRKQLIECRNTLEVRELLEKRRKLIYGTRSTNSSELQEDQNGNGPTVEELVRFANAR